jgi:hypothetical protein
VAAAITQQTGREVHITPGSRGEFTVWVGEQKVAGKTPTGFPDEASCVSAVERAL